MIDVCFEKAVDSLSILSNTEVEIKLNKIFNYLRNLVCTSFVAMSQHQVTFTNEIQEIKDYYEE